MSAILERMTNAPVYLPPELAVKRRAVEEKWPDFRARWQSWRFSLGGGRYQSVSRSSPHESEESSAMISQEEDGAGFTCAGSTCGGDQEGHYDGGMMRVLCPGTDTRIRRSANVLVAVWFTISYGTYGVATWNNQLFADVGLSNPFLCSFVYSLSNLPGNVGSIVLVERVGRKRLLSTSMALAAMAATLFALGSGSGAGVIVSGACLFNAFSTCGWNALGVVSTEAFPTASRVSGMGLVSAAGRMGSIAAQFVNGSLEENVLVLLMVTSGLTLVGSVASLLLPRETLGLPLDDHDPPPKQAGA